MDEIKTKAKQKLVSGYVEPQILADLRQYLDQQDMVILIDTLSAIPLTNMLCSSEALARTARKVVVISTAIFLRKPGNHTYRTVTEGEMRVLLGVYRSYEPSDHLLLLSDNRIYGSLWNYVKSGLLSSEEMFDAMLA